MTAKVFSIRLALIMAAIVISAGLLWLRASPDAHDEHISLPQQQVTRTPDIPPASPAADDGVRVPDVRVHATTLRHEGEPSALLAIDGAPARWFRRNTEIHPGFVISAIDRDQVTVRQGHAYYEFRLSNRGDKPD